MPCCPHRTCWAGKSPRARCVSLLRVDTLLRRCRLCIGSYKAPSVWSALNVVACRLLNSSPDHAALTQGGAAGRGATAAGKGRAAAGARAARCQTCKPPSRAALCSPSTCSTTHNRGTKSSCRSAVASHTLRNLLGLPPCMHMRDVQPSPHQRCRSGHGSSADQPAATWHAAHGLERTTRRRGCGPAPGGTAVAGGEPPCVSPASAAGGRQVSGDVPAKNKNRQEQVAMRCARGFRRGPAGAPDRRVVAGPGRVHAPSVGCPSGLGRQSLLPAPRIHCLPTPQNLSRAGLTSRPTQTRGPGRSERRRTTSQPTARAGWWG